MITIIDPQNSGISGNMILGALLDLGADPKTMVEIMETSSSEFGGVEVNILKVRKSGIHSTYVDVNCQDYAPVSYADLRRRISRIKHDNISEKVINLAQKVFKTLAETESKIHGIPLEKIHFHEVGAADAVADVMGAAYGFYELELDKGRVFGLPPALGGGRVLSEHGNVSAPAPATLEILKNVPAIGGPVDYELTTPTGAAILVNLVDEFCEYYPPFISQKIGYGAGKMDLKFPNILKIIQGTGMIDHDTISMLETNLDNVSGEIIGHTFHKLISEGALDVTVLPTITKKNRPGHLLRVIIRPEDCHRISETIIRETGTLGVRILPYVHRDLAFRKIIRIKVNFEGVERDIRIKVGMIKDEIISYSPEFEDAKLIAKQTGLPLKDVMSRAKETFKKTIEN